MSNEHAAENTILLAIETSAANCGVALSRGGALLGEHSLWIPNIHDKALATLCSTLLKNTGVDIADVGAIAVSSGPGSFTGLRIGAAFAKALCYGDSPKLIAVPTLAAFAAASDEVAVCLNVNKILVLCSSQRDVYFVQEFSPDATPLGDVMICSKAETQERITQTSFLCGTAAAEFDGVNLSGLNRPSPRFIARLGYRMLREQRFTIAADYVPAYHQDFVPKQAPQNSITL